MRLVMRLWVLVLFFFFCKGIYVTAWFFGGDMFLWRYHGEKFCTG